MLISTLFLSGANQCSDYRFITVSVKVISAQLGFNESESTTEKKKNKIKESHYLQKWVTLQHRRGEFGIDG